jgi:succinyldiaminopimelate transaminase
VTEPFRLPPYPYDRLKNLWAVADEHAGGCVDLSAGTPGDPAPDAVRRALATSEAESGYPPSVGSLAFKEAACGWLARRFDVTLPTTQLAACVGTKELVVGLPHWLKLRSPERDTVLYPEVSYPSYAMGASLAGCRPIPYTHLDDIAAADAERALCVWVNSPSNPTGELIDLPAAAEWGRRHGVPVLSDECYIEFTWDGPGRTILSTGSDGVLAVHSLSKRSNLAGVRAGFYAGDAELVHFLSEVRKHAGMMVPGPVQAAAVVAFGDDEHVTLQRERYRRRLDRMAEVLADVGLKCARPAGAFYLWVEVPPDPAAGGAQDGWELAAWLAAQGGMLVTPGDFFGPSSSDHVRIAMVRPDERLELVASRLNGQALPSGSGSAASAR